MKMNDILHMVRLYILYILIMLSVMFVSCQRGNMINYGVSYDIMCDIGKDRSESFCIVLYDSTSFTSEDYIESYTGFVPRAYNMIVDFIEVDSENNDWYVKMLRPEVLPLTCIFDSNGILVDLIPGSSSESMKYVNLVLEQGEPTTEFHFNGLYGDDKLDKIRLFRKIIRIRKVLESGKNILMSIDSLQEDMYPYLLYLELENQISLKDSTAAQATAERLLEFNSAGDLVTYEDELFYANQILDPGYDSLSAPKIQIEPMAISLDRCKVGESVPVVLKVTNIGHRLLKISDIITSCSCIQLMSDIKDYDIYPDDNAYVGFYFIPDQEGNIKRDVFIASNSYKMPLCHVTVSATRVSATNKN